MSKKMGRPEKENPRNEVIQAYLTEDEQELVEKVADQKNMYVSRLARKAILEYCTREWVPE